MPTETARLGIFAALFATVTLIVGAHTATAQSEADTTLRLPVSATKFIELGAEITRVSTGSSDIADVKAFPPDQLLVTGRRPGVTNATVWTRKGVQVLAIAVVYPEQAIRAALKQALPHAKKINATTAGASLILSGEVSSVDDIARAEALARSLIAGSVGTTEVPIVNTMRVVGNQQVQLEVTFAEVSRSELKRIGFNFWSKHASAGGKGYAGGVTSPTTNLSNIAPETSSPDIGNLNHGDVGFDTTSGKQLTNVVPLVANPVQGAFGFIFSSTLGGFPFSAALSLLSSHGYSRTLAEPTLVALSGKTANFLAGGEFPVPIPQGLGQTSIEYRKFGVQLGFTPTIVGDDIQLDLAMTVSDVDPSLGVTIEQASVPGLTSRHSDTTIRLKDGQSFVIAGLLSDKVRSTVDKVPWLGDLPILGVLFRSSAYRRDETELLVVVTAHRVAPLDEKPELPGEHATSDPSDVELFLFGKAESIDTGEDDTPRRRRHHAKAHRPMGAVGFDR